MPRSVRPRSPVTVSLATRVLRRWREGLLVTNVGVAGAISRLPSLEHALRPEGALEAGGIGLGAGLTWMLVRGLFSSRYDFSKLDDETDGPLRRTTSAPPAAQPLRFMTVSPSGNQESPAPSGPATMAARPNARTRASSLPPPASGVAMPTPKPPSLPPPRPVSSPPRGASSMPPHGASSMPPRRQSSMPPHGASSMPPRRQSSTPPHGASSMPPAKQPSLPPPPSAALARITRAMPPPANDSEVAGQPRALEGDPYIDTTGETEPVASRRPSQRPGPGGSARPSEPPLTTLDVIVMEDHALPHSGVLPSLEPDLLNQLEDVRAELIALSPSTCFVVGVSSDVEHRQTKTEAAVQLALSLALSGSRRVLLLEADPTQPVLDRLVGIHVPHAAGVSQQLHRRMAESAPTWTVVRVAESLDVLAEGRFRTPGVFYSKVFASALAELRLHYDVIVADGPIVETSESASSFGEVTDGIAYLTSGMPSIRMPRERALVRFHDKRLFKVLRAS